MTKYFRICKNPYTYQGICSLNKKNPAVTEMGAGLNEDCKEGGKHDWLLLPFEEGQKQYLECLKCHEYSHF